MIQAILFPNPISADEWQKWPRLNVGGIVALVRRARGACRDSDRLAWPGFVGRFSGSSFVQASLGSPRPIAIVQASAVAAGRDMPEIGTSPVPDTLTKSDRLPVTYISTVEPLATEPQVPRAPIYGCSKDH